MMLKDSSGHCKVRFPRTESETLFGEENFKFRNTQQFKAGGFGGS